MKPQYAENMEWLRASPWIAELAEKPDIESPRILVVDDDPLFCKRIAKNAQRNHLSVTTCKTVGDLTVLPSRLPFDVAIVDYDFGELTAEQVVHLIGEDIPVILISGTDRREIREKRWPLYIKAFVHKNRGLRAILNEALAAGGSKRMLMAHTISPAVSRPAPLWVYIAWTASVMYLLWNLGIAIWFPISLARVHRLLPAGTQRTELHQKPLANPTKELKATPFRRWDLVPRYKWDRAPTPRPVRDA